MHHTIRLAQQTLQQVGTAVMRYYDRQHRHQHNTLQSQQEITELALEQAIELLQNTREHYPVQLATASEQADGPHWVFNPMDGINAFAHHIPQFCMSLCLVEQQHVSHSVIYDPINQSIFYASKGQGAYGNDGRLRVSDTKTVGAQSLIALTHGDNNTDASPVQQLFGTLAEQKIPMYYHASPTLTLAYMAAGKVDALIGKGIPQSAMRPGLLLVKEAGALICNWQGEAQHDYDDISIANPKLQPTLLKLLRRSATGLAT
jgi:myo-inositol-1(or 4)-monophosphatase